MLEICSSATGHARKAQHTYVPHTGPQAGNGVKSLTMSMASVILRIAAGVALTLTTARRSTAIARDSRARLSDPSVALPRLMSPQHIAGPVAAHRPVSHTPSRVQRRSEHPRCFHLTAHVITLLTSVCLVAVLIGLKSEKGRFADAAISITSLNDSVLFGIDGYPYD